MFLYSIHDNFVDVPQELLASCDVFLKPCEEFVLYSNTVYFYFLVRVAR